MPDFSDDPIKFNPDNVSDPNVGDYTGSALVGGPMGVVRWASYAEIAPPVPADPALQNHIIGTARFTDADGAGLYGIGTRAKAASGASSGEPIQIFPFIPAFMIAGQQFMLGILLAVNSVAVPSSTDIEAGFYPVGFSGSGQMVYTLSETGKIVTIFGAGLIASYMNTVVPATDATAALAAGGNQQYALGVKLSAGLPAGCVVDAFLSLQISAY